MCCCCCFFGATIAVLNTAFTEAGEQSRRDILDGNLIALLAAAEPGDDAELVLPERLREPRFGQIDSGLYGELRDAEGAVIWRSTSALGLEIPDGPVPETGNQIFSQDSLRDGTPLLTLSLAVDWEFDGGVSKSYVFKVAESMDSFNAQVAGISAAIIRLVRCRRRNDAVGFFISVTWFDEAAQENRNGNW